MADGMTLAGFPAFAASLLRGFAGQAGFELGSGLYVITLEELGA
jgi:hypothetical protein